MKIAVTYDNGEVFQHFGHAEQFKMYYVEDGTIQSSEVVSTNGSGHSAIAQFLVDNSVDTLICGGIGGCAQRALAEGNIKLYGGVVGNADEAVSALLSGSLVFDPNAKCSHHEHSHAEGEHHHACGGHCHH
ncbi:NifB/NifX family molybdenum-iron cluster-binding protein [bacterium]|nr:NifB/NifX family molybdenum-iron cluster-binding protein [bacterium]MBO5446097.1 NifB/NifX family molybdenum-iron cluster-binding protein [bacterium]